MTAPESNFQVGMTVEITKLKRRGRIIVIKNGKATVQVGSLKISTALDALVHVTQLEQRVDPAKPTRTNIRAPGNYKTPAKQAKLVLDLHGFTVAQTINKLEECLNRAVLDGCHHIEVVHGIGSGRVRQAVHDYCSRSEVVNRYALRDFNTGITDLYL